MTDSSARNVSSASHVVETEDVLFRAFGNEAVLLHLTTEQYYSLNETGLRTWQLFHEGLSIDETCARLAEEFNADGEQIRRDVFALVEDLHAAGLISIRD